MPFRTSGRLDDTLFVVLYDEHGGFYDHVLPPLVEEGANDPRDTAEHFGRYGVRVPALVITPFVPVGGVSHVLFDHTSVARTILDRFCPGATLATRPQVASSLAEALTDRPAGRIAHPSAADIVTALETQLAARALAASRPVIQEVHGLLEQWNELFERLRLLPLA